MEKRKEMEAEDSEEEEATVELSKEVRLVLLLRTLLRIYRVASDQMTPSRLSWRPTCVHVRDYIISLEGKTCPSRSRAGR